MAITRKIEVWVGFCEGLRERIFKQRARRAVGFGGGNKFETTELIYCELREPNGAVGALGDAMHDRVGGGHLVVGDRRAADGADLFGVGREGE